MADKVSTTVYGVQRIDGRGGQTFDIGTLSYGQGGHLEVMTADPAYQAYLAEVVNTVNATDELSIKVPPPADTEPYSVYFRIVDRTAPDLLDVMRTYLERDYGLLLAKESTIG